MAPTAAFVLLLSIAALATTNAGVIKFVDMQVLGDSLSDPMNFPDLVPGTPDFSNDKKAVDFVASLLGLPPSTPSYHLSRGLPAAGNNNAYSNAATTDGDGDLTTPDPNLPTQVNALLATKGGVLPPDNLYFMWLGNIDVLRTQNILYPVVGQGLDPPPLKYCYTHKRKKHHLRRRSLRKKIGKRGGGGKKGRRKPKKPDHGKRSERGGKKGRKAKQPCLDWDQFEPFIQARDAIRVAVESQLEYVNIMIAQGAESFFVAGVPDIGITPIITGQAQVFLNTPNLTDFDRTFAAALPELFTELSVMYNKLLSAGLQAINKDKTLPNVHTEFLDMVDALQELAGRADELGFTNLDSPCIFTFSQGGAPNPLCDPPAATGFLFWDELHPTSAVHEVAANLIVEQIKSGFKSKY